MRFFANAQNDDKCQLYVKASPFRDVLLRARPE